MQGILKKRRASGEGHSEETPKPRDPKGEEAAVDPALGLADKGTGSDDEWAEAEGMEGGKDPLFDASLDAGDEAWVKRQRAGRGASDAVLNCPACMTTLSRDCQRHAEFPNQFRALFVEHCSVDETSRVPSLPLKLPSTFRFQVFCPSAAAKKAAKRKRKAVAGPPDDTQATELLKPNTTLPADQPLPQEYQV